MVRRRRASPGDWERRNRSVTHWLARSNNEFAEHQRLENVTLHDHQSRGFSVLVRGLPSADPVFAAAVFSVA